MAITVPPTLNKTPFTKTPFLVYLHGADTEAPNKWRGWTREEVKAAGKTWVLPMPERGFGTNTELKVTDEESVLRYPSTLGKATGMGSKFVSTIAGAIPLLGGLITDLDQAMRGHGIGGAGVPLDFTSLTVYGNKKRSFRFIFDLYALDSKDSGSISRFCREMHGNSMVRPGHGYLTTPYVWTFSIFTSSGEDVTALWFPDPGACAMVNVSDTPSNFIHTHDGTTSARSIVTLTLTEIEPMGYHKGAFVPTWSFDPF
jgi:hypothetical protein